MRLIDADALNEELSSLGMTITGLRAGKGVLNEFMMEYRKSVLQIVDDAPTIEAEPVRHGKWISVEERLPEAKMAVLAYGQRFVFNGKTIETFPMERVAYTRGPDEGWFSWDSGDVIEVTHWMPLPKPPKED